MAITGWSLFQETCFQFQRLCDEENKASQRASEKADFLQERRFDAIFLA